MKTWLNRKLWVITSLSALLALGTACNVEQTEEGEIPDVDVETDSGQLPEYEVEQKQEGELPDVDVNTTGGNLPEYDVETPDVDVQTERRTIEVPDVDVEPAGEAETPER